MEDLGIVRKEVRKCVECGSAFEVGIDKEGKIHAWDSLGWYCAKCTYEMNMEYGCEFDCQYFTDDGQHYCIAGIECPDYPNEEDEEDC